jgi:ATP-dependent Lon protease
MTSDPKKESGSIAEDDSEVIIRPTMLDGDEPASPEKMTIPHELAILPVRNMVIFPGMVVPLSIGREKSKRLIESTLPDQKILVTLCQKSPEVEDPAAKDLYTIGTAVMVLKLLRMDEGNQSIIVHGLSRVRIEEWLATDPYLRARIAVLADQSTATDEGEALLMNARNLARRVIQLSPNIPDEAAVVLNNIDQPGALSDFLASNLQLDIPVKQELLETLEVSHRLRRMGIELQHQVDILELSNKIQDQVKANIDKSQREYFLQEQLKAIQKELGQMDEKTAELEQLKAKIDEAGMNETVKTEALHELGRLERVPIASPEYSVIRTYLDVIDRKSVV